MSLRIGDLYFYNISGDYCQDYCQLVVKIDNHLKRFYVKEFGSESEENGTLSFSYDENDDEAAYYPLIRWTKI